MASDFGFMVCTFPKLTETTNGAKTSLDSRFLNRAQQSKNPILMFDRKVLLPLVTWRFEKDGNDTYIENPEEARAYRKGIPWEPGSPH